MNISGILTSIYIAILPIYFMITLTVQRTLNQTELEIYKSDNKFIVISFVAIGVIGFITLIINRETEWALTLGIGLVLLSILEASFFILDLIS